MSTERQQLEAAISAIEACRGLILPAMMAATEQLLAGLQHPEKLDSTELPGLRLAAYDALHAASDTRAAAMLATALAELNEQALRISDASVRPRFVHEVPTNRRIVQASLQAD